MRAGAALLGLLSPVLVGLAPHAGSAASATPAATTSAFAPVQRYITANVNKKEVEKGHKVKISGAVTADAPSCAVGVVLNVERSTTGATYKVVDTVTTDSTGAYKAKETVKKKARYRISAPATDACSELMSPPRTVKVVS